MTTRTLTITLLLLLMGCDDVEPDDGGDDMADSATPAPADLPGDGDGDGDGVVEPSVCWAENGDCAMSDECVPENEACPAGPLVPCVEPITNYCTGYAACPANWEPACDYWAP